MSGAYRCECGEMVDPKGTPHECPGTPNDRIAELEERVRDLSVLLTKPAEAMPADRPLAPGDTVQLKSGGPTMTATGEGTQWRCFWFDGADLRSGLFPESALSRVEPPVAPVVASAEPDAWQEDTKPAGWRPKDDIPFFAHEAAGPWRPVSSSAIPDAEQRFIVLVTWERPLRKVSL